MQIRNAAIEDCHAVAALHVDAWRHAYRGIFDDAYLTSLSITERETMWRRMVEAHPGRLLVAHDSNRVASERDGPERMEPAPIVGFVAFGPSHDQDAPMHRAEIYAIYVAAARWSTGIGRALWLEASHRIAASGSTTVSLWVLSRNRRAIRFYERAGFIAESGRKSLRLGDTELEESRLVRDIGS